MRMKEREFGTKTFRVYASCGTKRDVIKTRDTGR